MRIDLHTHSNVSDGTDDPDVLVERAKAAGLDVVALTDHDTFDGLDRAAEAAQRVGIRLVRGAELSCRLQGASVHLLGYALDEDHPELSAELVRVRQGRSDRVGPVLAKLAALGVQLTEDDVLRQVGDSPSAGRPHIADALVVAGYVADRREAFDRYLADGGPAHVTRYSISLPAGIDLVHAAGGRAVIAHPWGRSSRSVLTPDVLAGLVAGHELDGMEVDHQDHDRQVRAELRALAGDLGLLATGSSDYHGEGKVDHDLGVNTTDPAVFAQLLGG